MVTKIAARMRANYPNRNKLVFKFSAEKTFENQAGFSMTRAC